MSDHYGNLEIYGYVTVGKNTANSYRFPLSKGENGEFIGVENGEVVFKRPGPSIYISEISGASNLLNSIDDISAYIIELSGSDVLINNSIDELTASVIEISGAVPTFNGVETINSESPSANNIDFVSDGSIDIIPNGNGTIQISLYVPISTNLTVTSVDVSGVGSISSNSLENGMVVDQTSLNWNSYNKVPTSQSLNQGIGSLSIGTTTYVHIDSYSTDRTYTLTYSDGQTTSNDSVNINFRDRRFWGTTSSSSNLIESDIEAGSNELASSRGKSITFAANGNRIFYAYPTSFGLATVKDQNGLTFQSWTDGGVEVTSPYTISVTNNYGFTQNYYVYQSFNTFGASSIQFVWS